MGSIKNKMENTKISIIIPHYKTPDILMECLDAIFGEIKDISYEVIVSDGESDKKSIEGISGKYSSVLFIENKENLGFAKLVNIGLRKAKGEYIFVINADILIKNGNDILKIVDYMEQNENVGFLGPRLLNLDGSVQQTYFRNYTFLTVLARRSSFGKTKWGMKILDIFNYGDQKIAGPFEPDWILGAAFLLSRKNLEKIGGKLDERYFMYFEDADLCRSFKEAGLRVVYFPDSGFIHHHARASDKGGGIFDVFQNKLTRIHIISYLKYLWKWDWRYIEKTFKTWYNIENKKSK